MTPKRSLLVALETGRVAPILLKKSMPQGFCPRWRRSVFAAQAVTGATEWVAGGWLIFRLVPPRLCSHGYDARRLRFDQLGQLA
jgi:hypothetical protein